MERVSPSQLLISSFGKFLVALAALTWVANVAGGHYNCTLDLIYFRLSEGTLSIDGPKWTYSLDYYSFLTMALFTATVGGKL